MQQLPRLSESAIPCRGLFATATIGLASPRISTVSAGIRLRDGDVCSIPPQSTLARLSRYTPVNKRSAMNLNPPPCDSPCISADAAQYGKWGRVALTVVAAESEGCCATASILGAAGNIPSSRDRNSLALATRNTSDRWTCILLISYVRCIGVNTS